MTFLYMLMKLIFAHETIDNRTAKFRNISC